MKTLRQIQLDNCADWNAEQAADAYRDGEIDRYCRFIAQSARLRQMARTAK
jgi:hypothetical protein